MYTFRSKYKALQTFVNIKDVRKEVVFSEGVFKTEDEDLAIAIQKLPTCGKFYEGASIEMIGGIKPKKEDGGKKEPEKPTEPENPNLKPPNKNNNRGNKK